MRSIIILGAGIMQIPAIKTAKELDQSSLLGGFSRICGSDEIFHDFFIILLEAVNRHLASLERENENFRHRVDLARQTRTTSRRFLYQFRSSLDHRDSTFLGLLLGQVYACIK